MRKGKRGQKKVRPPEPSEWSQQCAVITRVNLESIKYPELKRLVGSPNGVRLSIGQAMKLKRAGCLNPGFPDLFLPVIKLPHYGLFIELKKKKDGKPSLFQKEWLEYLNEHGFLAVVAEGSDEAISLIMDYIKR